MDISTSKNEGVDYHMVFHEICAQLFEPTDFRLGFGSSSNATPKLESSQNGVETHFVIEVVHLRGR